MTAQNILFNDGWQFCLCDIGTELSALPGRHWYDVELPRRSSTRPARAGTGVPSPALRNSFRAGCCSILTAFI